MHRLTIGAILAVVISAASGWSAPNVTASTKEDILDDFIAQHVRRVKALSKEARLAGWRAATTGESEAYEEVRRLRIELSRIYSNRDEFAWLKRMRESGAVKDARLRRQLDRLYLGYLEDQIDDDLRKQMIDLNTDINKRFKTFRSTIDGEKVTLNDIDKILTTETDSRKREQAWRASKQVGDVIVDDFLRLVKLRNQAARQLGFDNYHTLSLTTSEQDPAELDRIFNELYELTNEPYAKVKAELDRALAKRYGIAPEQLMPWHYHDPFFQRAPLVYELDLNVHYAKVDVREVAEKFYAGIGLPVDDVLARSDLFEREGKDPNAFMTNIDREGDVRILCNLKNTERWMEIVLHELGHAVYGKHHDSKEPYLLRSPAHSFATEGVAMFFGRLSRNAAWMQPLLGLSDAQREEIDSVAAKYTQLQQLIFARWAMVMYNFEKQIYANPDQDLNNLWWDMIQKYQRLKKPDGPVDAGWASKQHFTGASCYYHNYMLGELFASQLHHRLVNDVLKKSSDADVGYVGEKKIGEFLREKVFAPGAIYPWNEMVARATGEPLTAKYFVKQFVK